VERIRLVTAGRTAVAQGLERTHAPTWRRRVVVAAAALLVLVIVWPGQADLVVAFTNVGDGPVEVSVGGDRLLIIGPHETGYLPVNPYVWAWPRRVEVRRYPHGEALHSWRADLTDLAQNRWRLRIP
jgi:hypothetical protein